MGKIILLEGTDKSGKETQAKALVQRLSQDGIGAEIIGIPDYTTPAGRIVGQCYLGKDLGLGEEATCLFGDPDQVPAKLASGYYALERFAHIPRIEEILAEGKFLVLDRWVESNMGHQAGKIRDPAKRIEMFNWLNRLEYEVLGLPRPDLRVFLHMPTDVGLELGKRMGEKGDGHENNIGHLRRAEAAYLEMTDYFEGWHKIECAPDGTMESLKNPEEIAREVYGIVERTFAKQGKLL